MLGIRLSGYGASWGSCRTRDGHGQAVRSPRWCGAAAGDDAAGSLPSSPAAVRPRASAHRPRKGRPWSTTRELRPGCSGVSAFFARQEGLPPITALADDLRAGRAARRGHRRRDRGEPGLAGTGRGLAIAVRDDRSPDADTIIAHVTNMIDKAFVGSGQTTVQRQLPPFTELELFATASDEPAGRKVSRSPSGACAAQRLVKVMNRQSELIDHPDEGGNIGAQPGRELAGSSAVFADSGSKRWEGPRPPARGDDGQRPVGTLRDVVQDTVPRGTDAVAFVGRRASRVPPPRECGCGRACRRANEVCRRCRAAGHQAAPSPWQSMASSLAGSLRAAAAARTTSRAAVRLRSGLGHTDGPASAGRAEHSRVRVARCYGQVFQAKW